MDSGKANLYSKHDLHNPGELKHKSQATRKDDSEVQIELYENGVVENHSKNFEQKRSFAYDFDIKFSFTTSPPEVTF